MSTFVTVLSHSRWFTTAKRAGTSYPSESIAMSVRRRCIISCASTNDFCLVRPGSQTANERIEAAHGESHTGHVCSLAAVQETVGHVSLLLVELPTMGQICESKTVLLPFFRTIALCLSKNSHRHRWSIGHLVRRRKLSVAIQIHRSVSIRFSASDVHRCEHSSASAYLFQWSHLSLDPH